MSERRRARRPIRKIFFSLVSISGGLAIALIVTELTLRLFGFAPWRSTPRMIEPILHRPDPILGWRTEPGTHRYGPYASEGKPIKVTILPDGSRATGGGSGEAEQTLVFLGGSFTFGHAVSDRDTFAWRIQQRFPGVRVKNYGAGGYGTVQATLLLEELLSGADPPDHIIYGFIVGHDSRNVAHPGWLRMLAGHSRGSMVATPYCTLTQGGELVWHSPKAMELWPLADASAAVHLLQDSIHPLLARDRPPQAEEVTRKLLVEMNELATGHGARLRVAILHGHPRKVSRYEAFLRSQEIQTIDCTGEYPLPDDLRVPGEGHPNAAKHAAWAECIGRSLRLAPSDGNASESEKGASHTEER